MCDDEEDDEVVEVVVTEEEGSAALVDCEDLNLRIGEERLLDGSACDDAPTLPRFEGAMCE